MTGERALKLTAESRSGYLQVAVAGDIDIASAGTLHAFLARRLCTAAAAGGLVVDLSEVRFIDARGLRALLRARHMAADLQIPFALGGPAPCVSRLLKLTGLRGHFTIAPSEPGQVIQPARTSAEAEL